MLTDGPVTRPTGEMPKQALPDGSMTRPTGEMTMDAVADGPVTRPTGEMPTKPGSEWLALSYRRFRCLHHPDEPARDLRAGTLAAGVSPGLRPFVRS